MAQLLTSISEIPGLSSGARRVLFGLISFRNKDDGKCCPKFDKLCQRLGVAWERRRKVFRWLAELRAKGIVVSQRRRFAGVVWYEFPGLSIGVKNGTSIGVKNGTCIDDKNDTYGGPPPLYEQTVLNRQSAAAAADPVRGYCKPAAARSAPAAAAAPPSASRGNNPKTNTNTSALARTLTADLVAVHPQPGLPGKAQTVIQELLAKSDDPERTAAMIRAHHPQWIEYWSGLYAGQFVPQLWRWITDGEWQHPPVIRKPPKSYFEERRSAVERLREQARTAV